MKPHFLLWVALAILAPPADAPAQTPPLNQTASADERLRGLYEQEWQHRSAALIWGTAGLIGAALGIGSVAVNNGNFVAITAVAKPLAVSAGVVRARAPREGDHWSRCDDARAAGSAPLYAGEPGYRSGPDGDGDGIACEPYRGM